MNALLTLKERRALALLASLLALGYALLGFSSRGDDPLPCNLDSLDTVFRERAAGLWVDSTITQSSFEPHASRPLSTVDINTASFEELITLPGVGPTRARSILELRQALGSFKTVNELLEVHGIGPATLRRMVDYIQVGAKRP